MYKIMIYINTYSGDKWFYYQENEKDYVAHSLHEIKETVLTLIDTYGKDNIKIVKQVTGEDMEGSVETFIYDSTDNYEELVNRPSINGVEIIGALSLAELGIQPAGDYATNAKVDELEQAVNNIDLNPYATNERVDQVETKVDNIDLTPYATNVRVDQVEHKVDNIDLTPYATNARVDQVEAKVDAIDLEPYATMDYLDEVVANIDFSSTNEEISGIKTFSVLPRSAVMPVTEDELTNKSYVDHGVENCASKEYVDTAISNIKIPEVDGYATTEYVDEAVANIDIPESGGAECVYNLVNKTMSEPFKAVNLGLDESSVPGFRNALKQSVNAGYKSFMINVYFSKTGEKLELRCTIDGETIGISCWKAWYIYEGSYLAMWNPIKVGGISSISEIDTADAFIRLNFQKRSVYVPDSSKVLRKDNTTEFTPTGDYHPATKKYVDDAIAAIEIPEAGGSDIDLSNILTKDNTEEFTPDGDYEPATKKYVDDENKGLVILEKLNFGAQPGNGYGITDEVILNKILNGMLKGGNYYPAFLGVGVSGKQVLFTFVSSYTSNQYKSFTYMGTTTLGEKTNTSEVHKLTFTINGMGYMSSDTKTISNVNTSFSHINRSLNTDNTISYTPTADYHPSTKKYVDDAIAAAITTVLGGEY